MTCLPAISLITAKQGSVSSLLLSLASNTQANIHLAFAIHKLSSLGVIRTSTVFVSHDYRCKNVASYQQSPDYSNQCAIIILHKATKLSTIIDYLKSIEATCHRSHDIDNKRVTLDIDVLAIKSETQSHWLTIAKRYPFKPHEIVGINELFISMNKQRFIG